MERVAPEEATVRRCPLKSIGTDHIPGGAAVADPKKDTATRSEARTAGNFVDLKQLPAPKHLANRDFVLSATTRAQDRDLVIY